MPSSAALPHLHPFPTRRSSDLVRVTCQCGTSYELKDEFAGRLVKCPQCGRENRVPGVEPATAVKRQADPVFDRDVFLLRQQLLRRSEEHTSELQSRFDLVCRLLPPSHTSTLSLHDALPISSA